MAMLEPNNLLLSMRQQCKLLDLCRSSFYYEPAPCSLEDLRLMHVLDEIFTDNPSYGSRRLTMTLRRHDFEVNRKHVIRLMLKMGLQAVFPKKSTSLANAAHKKYPYLLTGVDIVRPNQVWSTDITYIRMSKGFLYLVAILDWYSRFVLSWKLSNTLDTSFCLEALEEALLLYEQPEIFNSDQGCQFTSSAFSEILIGKDIKISMAGRGRCFDNIFSQRFWRTLKWEEVYLNNYVDGLAAEKSLGDFMIKYNQRRGHQSLDYFTPMEKYFGIAIQQWLQSPNLLKNGVEFLQV
jgi:putative transposase